MDCLRINCFQNHFCLTASQLMGQSGAILKVCMLLSNSRDKSTLQAIELSSFATTVFNCWDQLFSFLLRSISSH